MENDDYTGKHFTVTHSIFDGMSVNVLEYKRNDGNYSPGFCFRCGRKLKRHWWTVQTAEDDLVICELGPECVKHLS